MQMVLEDYDDEADSSDSADSVDGLEDPELDDDEIDSLMEQMHDPPVGVDEFRRWSIQQKVVTEHAASRTLFKKAKHDRTAKVVFDRDNENL